MFRTFVSRMVLSVTFLIVGENLFAQSWQQIAPVLLPRQRPDCALLPNGKVLLIGGEIQPSAIAECEIYDPKLDTWTITGSLNTPRFWFAHTILLDGRIFVAGGWTQSYSAPTNTCEIYDPKTGIWSYTASMARTRTQFQAITLPNGKVLLLGGTDTTSSDTSSLAEEFDPATGTMSTITSPQPSHFGYEMAYSRILNGIIAAGGVFQLSIEPQVSIVQLYNLNTFKWELLSPLIEPEEGFMQLVQTPEGKFALMAGRNAYKGTTKRVQVFNPDSDTWSTGGYLPFGHDYGSSFNIQGDSIITIGGLDITGNYNTVKACDIIDLKTGNSWIGPTPNVNRTSQAAIMLTSIDSSECTETRSVYLFTGEASLLGYTPSCERLSYTFPHGSNPLLSLSSVIQIAQRTCLAVDTAVRVNLSGCGFTFTSLDSAWITGSHAFSISDMRSTPRTLATVDSILVSYSSNVGPDTSELHLQYNIGAGEVDTIVRLLGTASPIASQPSLLHRESASSYYGQSDTLPMEVDLSSRINIDSLWPFLTEMQGTYSWDSSIVSFAGYSPPLGWILNSIANHRNSADFDISNSGSATSIPLDVGTAFFRPNSEQLESSWVTLSNFTLDIGNQRIGLCINDNEDSHWAVKTLGVQSGVAEVPAVGGIVLIYPNPAENEITVLGSRFIGGQVQIFNELGVATPCTLLKKDGGISMDVSSLPSGLYYLRLSENGYIVSKTVAIEH